MVDSFHSVSAPPLAFEELCGLVYASLCSVQQYEVIAVLFKC